MLGIQREKVEEKRNRSALLAKSYGECKKCQGMTIVVPLA
jgi:hypothetical protein